jgi:RNA ligase
MSEMIAFPSIESLRHVVKGTEIRCKINNLPLPKVEYVGTVKLHGSNASVRFTNGEIIPQSRNRVLSVGDDNFGFAAFVEKNKDIFKSMTPRNGDLTFYGEWCGGSVQPKVALEQLEKHFVIFSMLHNDIMYPIARVVSESEFDITTFNKAGIYFIHQIPLYKITVDFSRPEDVIEELTDLTIAVEQECPWGKFRGVSGIGEGIVWAPVDNTLPFEMWFKTKGLEHKKGAKAPKVEVAPEVMQTQRELAEKLLPQWRLEQGISVLRERGLDVEPKNIGVYLQWISEDILKEEQDVMAANGTDWKKINPIVLQRARQYILELCKKF